MIGIYKITNPACEVYIGQSKNIEKRVLQHKRDSKNLYLKESIEKYGFENHKIETLCECLEIELQDKEIFYIEKYSKTNILFNREFLKMTPVNVRMLPIKEIISDVRCFAKKRSIQIKKGIINNEKYFKVLVWFRYVCGDCIEKDFEIHYTYALSQEDAKRKVTIEHYSGNSAIPFKYEVNQIN